MVKFVENVLDVDLRTSDGRKNFIVGLFLLICCSVMMADIFSAWLTCSLK